jgi:hypothetical protein
MAAPSQSLPSQAAGARTATPRRGLFGLRRRARPAPVDPGNPLMREFVTPEGVDLRLQLGGAGERAAAFILDEVIITLSLILSAWVLGTVRARSSSGRCSCWRSSCCETSTSCSSSCDRGRRRRAR